MINIRLFPALMKFLIRLYLTKNYVWIRVHEQIKFNIVCSYVTTTGTATLVTKGRSSFIKNKVYVQMMFLARNKQFSIIFGFE